MRETSTEAFKYMKDTRGLTVRCLQVYSVMLSMNRAVTGAEVALGMKSKFPTVAQSETVRNRITELVKLGFVMELPSNTCPISKRKVIWYQAVMNPVPRQAVKKTRAEKYLARARYHEEKMKHYLQMHYLLGCQLPLL